MGVHFSIVIVSVSILKCLRFRIGEAGFVRGGDKEASKGRLKLGWKPPLWSPQTNSVVQRVKQIFDDTVAPPFDKNDIRPPLEDEFIGVRPPITAYNDNYTGGEDPSFVEIALNRSSSRGSISPEQGFPDIWPCDEIPGQPLDQHKGSSVHWGSVSVVNIPKEGPPQTKEYTLGTLLTTGVASWKGYRKMKMERRRKRRRRVESEEVEEEDELHENELVEEPFHHRRQWNEA